VAAAVTGLGIIYRSDFIVEAAVKAGVLQIIELDIPLIEMHLIFAITPANWRQPTKVRAFIDFLVKKLREPSALR